MSTTCPVKSSGEHGALLCLPLPTPTPVPIPTISSPAQAFLLPLDSFLLLLPSHTENMVPADLAQQLSPGTLHLWLEHLAPPHVLISLPSAPLTPHLYLSCGSCSCGSSSRKLSLMPTLAAFLCWPACVPVPTVPKLHLTLTRDMALVSARYERYQKY